MLIALAFAYFSSELLLKEQMIIPLKKNVKQRWSYRRKIDRFQRNLPNKIQRNRLFFHWLLLGEVSPRNFPWNRPIFLIICPWKSFEIWLFSAKIREISQFFCEFWLFFRENPAKSADFSTNLPLKIPRNFAFFSAKYQKPCNEYYLSSLIYMLLPLKCTRTPCKIILIAKIWYTLFLKKALQLWSIWCWTLIMVSKQHFGT